MASVGPSSSSIKKWICPLCQQPDSIIEDDSVLEEGEEREKKPLIEDIKQLIERANALEVEIEEEELLMIIYAKYQDWQEYIEDFIKNPYGNDNDNIGTSTVINIINYPMWKLSMFIKQATFIKVDSETLCHKLKRIKIGYVAHKKIQQYFKEWEIIKDSGIQRKTIKEDAVNILKEKEIEELPLQMNTKKITIEEIEKCLTDIDVIKEDSSYVIKNKLHKEIHESEKWHNNADKLIYQLKKYSDRYISEIPKELIQETKQHLCKSMDIFIKLNEEKMNSLIFQSSPYCLCRKTNDENRPMVACDYEEGCAIWYHLSCVGLDEHQPLPSKYCCPLCCLKLDEFYPYELPSEFKNQLCNNKTNLSDINIDEDKKRPHFKDLSRHQDKVSPNSPVVSLTSSLRHVEEIIDHLDLEDLMNLKKLIDDKIGNLK